MCTVLGAGLVWSAWSAGHQCSLSGRGNADVGLMLSVISSTCRVWRPGPARSLCTIS